MKPSDNLSKVLKIFKENYKLVPLEVFGSNLYKTLISTLMSARTYDTTTLKAARRLFKKAPTMTKLNMLTVEQIAKIIYPVGFYKTKAKHIKQLANIVSNDLKGEIPNTRDGLMNLPGVGRKTANLVLNRAFATPAIAVDTHVHRISNMLGWVNTKTPEETEKVLMQIIPQKHWSIINVLMVSIGQQFSGKKKLIDFLSKNGLIGSTNFLKVLSRARPVRN